MSRAMQWIGKNLSLGGLVRNVGSGLGTAGNLTVQGAGAAATFLARDAKTKQKLKSACATAGTAIDFALTKGSAVAGDGINYGVQKASSAVGHASGGIAKFAGASQENVVLAQKVGTIIGAVAVGVVAGAGIADAAVALGAAAGVAGGASTTSGLAALGGGSIAAGGGGMAAGHAVMQGIVAAGGASGAASLNKNDTGETT